MEKIQAQKIKEKFKEIGSSLILKNLSQRDVSNQINAALDIVTDKKGHEVFELRTAEDIELSILDIKKGDRHLLLEVKTGDKKAPRFLCGHDERHYFAAAIPEGLRSGNVEQAKLALLPRQLGKPVSKLKKGNKTKRHNLVSRRQGEWFFRKVDHIEESAHIVHKNEPLTRGRGKPHVAEYLIRTGGENLYVGRKFPQGITVEEYRNLKPIDRIGLNQRRLNATVLVKGRITHPDHKTLILDTWHQVFPNREQESRALRNLLFMD